jgi:hypothetical protein
MRYIVAAVIVALIIPTAVYGQGRSYFIYDLGRHSCGKYLAAVHGHPPGKGKVIKHPEGQFSDDHIRYMDWLGGFLTATNWWVTDEHNDIRTDNAAIDVWIRKWCEQNPTKHLVEAASEFVWDQRKDYLQGYFARQAR